jgi:hypothetical protein
MGQLSFPTIPTIPTMSITINHHFRAPNPNCDYTVWDHTFASSVSKDFTDWLSKFHKGNRISFSCTYHCNDTEACAILEHATHASKCGIHVVIHTELGGTCAYAPCGCTGYDDPCEYHRRGGELCDDKVAPCFCSREYNTLCEYHKDLNVCDSSCCYDACNNKKLLNTD